MAKVIQRKILPLFLVLIVLCGVLPVPALAAGPDISTDPTSDIVSEAPGESTPEAPAVDTQPGSPEIDTQPGEPAPQPEPTPPASEPEKNQPPSSESEAPKPDSSLPTESEPVAPSDSVSEPASSEAQDSSQPEEPETDTAEEKGGLDGASVMFVNSRARASGRLTIHRIPAYQWDFSQGRGSADIRPWYIMDINGAMAYCIEPTNPDTTSGEYNTIQYDSLTLDQQHAIGYALKYGAQNMSDPLFHMATQTIVWEIVYGYMDLTTFIATSNSVYASTIGYNPGAAGHYSNITAAMRAHCEIPSFTQFIRAAAPIHQMPGTSGEYKISLVNTNPNCDLADFPFTNTNTVKFTRDGQTLNVRATANVNPNTIFTAYKGSSGPVDSLIFWGKGSEQIRATAGQVEPVPAHMRLQTENTGNYTITIIKQQSGTNIPLSGGKFSVRHSERGTIGTFTTNGSGRVVVNVPWQGTYIVTEIEPPEGHELGENPVKDIVITTANPKGTLTYHNDAHSGIKITKIDGETKAPLAGVVFRIARKGTMEEQTVTTGADGIAVLNGLQPDWYTVTEVSVPSGYILDTEPRTVEIKAGVVATITIENYKKPTLEIIKVDTATGAALGGATFRIARRGGSEFTDIVSGADGVARLTGMQPDVYNVTEIKAPNGYILNDTPQTVEIVAGQITRIQMKNDKKPSLEVLKIDERTRQPLAGATFRIAKDGSKDFADIVTGADGIARINLVDPGTYTVTEIVAPGGYVLDSTDHIVELKPGQTTKVTLTNNAKPTLEISKVDRETKAPLAGAIFRISKEGGKDVADITSGADGIARLVDMEPGMYTVREIVSPDGYVLNDTEQIVQIVAGQITKITVENVRKPTLEITKIDEITHEPLAGATFRIALNGGIDYTDITSGADGIALLTNMQPGVYTVTEIIAPSGYVLDATPRTIEIAEGKVAKITVTNLEKVKLEILKIDSITKQPLAYATFKISYKNGRTIGEYTSDADGRIYLDGLAPGLIVVEEVTAPDGYQILNAPQEILLNGGESKTLTFENKPLSPVILKKVDSKTGEPLSGAVFRLTKMNGELVGEYKTGRNGYITVPELEPGWYTAVEIEAPDGYRLNNTPQNVQLKIGTPAIIEFENTALPGIQIKKLDSETGKPIAGVTIRLAKMNGEVIGDYVTDPTGLIAVPDLETGWYTAYETATVEGYILDNTPQNIELKDGQTGFLTFTNKPLAGLSIIKLDSVTGKGLEGVEFSLRRLNGENLGKFTTDADGRIFVPDLTEGYIVVRETKTLPGYKIDTTEQTIEIQSGKQNVLEFVNMPYPYMVIQKLDSETRQPISGVSFKIYTENGLEIGTYKTNSAGRIILTGIDAGTYQVQEVEAAPGYVLDSRIWNVTLEWGKTTTVTFRNDKLASLRIIKVDADTGEGIGGVTFMLYDMKNNIIGEFVTEQDGVITLHEELQPGKYRVKETKAAPGYVLDDTILTIEVKSGETTEIVVRNVPERGRIQIIKQAAEDNALTGQKKGDKLEGAVFEIYNAQLEVVDTLTTDEKGMATSTLLPLGIYTIKEVEAPEHWLLNDKEITAEIKVHDDLIRFIVEDNAPKISTTVEKRGVVEAVAGSVIRYDFKNIENTSNTALDDFYWHDLLPTDAVRLETIHTGMWNEEVTYRVMYKTNLKNNYTVLADNLNSTKNHVLDCKPAALGLAANEYITDFKFEFGTVKAGFKEKDAPFIFVRVLPELPNGYQFTNRTDTGGRFGSKWTYDKDAWVTVVFKVQIETKGRLPKTGAYL